MKLFFFISFIFIISCTFSGSVSAQNINTTANFSLHQLNSNTLKSASVFFVSFFNKKKNMRDSLIAHIENKWTVSRKLIEQDNYSDAINNIESIIAQIDTYTIYCKKNHTTPIIFADTAELLLSNCVLLDSLRPVISYVNSLSDSFPLKTDDLIIQKRHQLLAIMDRCKTAINSETNRNPDKKGAIRFGFRNTIIRLNILDSLFKAVYDDNKVEFSLKNRFFYNRAIDKNDTVQIRNFINDCDYYQVDKEWCTRARIILAGTDTSSKEISIPSDSKKFSSKDLMKIQYQQAIVSKRIDLLEEYIANYDKKRIKKSESKIDSVKLLLKMVKKEIETEMTYNKAYPLFANAELNQLGISIIGLSKIVQSEFKDIIRKNREKLRDITGIRFPANLQINYVSSNPILLITSYVNCDKDIQIASTDSGTTIFSITGVPQLMEFLNLIKKEAAESVKDRTQKIKLIRAAYVVRLYSNRNDYITFYGKEDSGELLFYDFFDITIGEKKDTRFSYKPSHNIEIFNVDNSQKSIMLREFFKDN